VAAQTVNLILAREPVRDNGQQQDQRDLAETEREFRRIAPERHQARLAPQVVSPQPRPSRQRKVPREEPGHQQLATLLDHGRTLPWGPGWTVVKPSSLA